MLQYLLTTFQYYYRRLKHYLFLKIFGDSYSFKNAMQGIAQRFDRMTKPTVKRLDQTEKELARTKVLETLKAIQFEIYDSIAWGVTQSRVQQYAFELGCYVEIFKPKPEATASLINFGRANSTYLGYCIQGMQGPLAFELTYITLKIAKWSYERTLNKVERNVNLPRQNFMTIHNEMCSKLFAFINPYLCPHTKRFIDQWLTRIQAQDSEATVNINYNEILSKQQMEGIHKINTLLTSIKERRHLLNNQQLDENLLNDFDKQVSQAKILFKVFKIADQLVCHAMEKVHMQFKEMEHMLTLSQRLIKSAERQQTSAKLLETLSKQLDKWLAPSSTSLENPSNFPQESFTWTSVSSQSQKRAAFPKKPLAQTKKHSPKTAVESCVQVNNLAAVNEPVPFITEEIRGNTTRKTIRKILAGSNKVKYDKLLTAMRSLKAPINDKTGSSRRHAEVLQQPLHFHKRHGRDRAAYVAVEVVKEIAEILKTVGINEENLNVPIHYLPSTGGNGAVSQNLVSGKVPSTSSRFKK